MIGAVLVVVAAVLPSERMEEANRLFGCGRYEQAAKEYRELSGKEGIAADEILFRLAECDRVSGRSAEALRGYAELVAKHPESAHASRARFLSAMGRTGLVRRKLLAELDSDRVDLETRTAALYHLGSEASDAEILEKCVKLDPKGKYAPYANLRYGMLLNGSEDPVVRRKGVEVLLGLAFSGGEFAGEALYLAAIQCYREKRYDEAGSLFRRYRRTYPKGEHFDEARSMSAWCEFREGRSADAVVTCGEGETDDLAYIRAVCAYSTEDNETALRLFRKYLDDYPQGAYRADAELSIARLESDDATVAYLEAMASARQGDWSAAERSLAAAMASGKLGGRTAEATYWRGVAAMNLGHAVEGAGFLENAVAAGVEPDKSREARLMVADFDYRSGRIGQAKTAYAKLVREGACERMSAARILAVGRMVDVDEAEVCARALTKNEAPEWRQAGWGLLGDCAAKRGVHSAAIESYRKCLAEPAKTETGAAAALSLGKLEFRAGEFDRADLSLKKAIELNAANARARAEAFVTLAKNAGAKGDWKSAVAYASVVMSLFDDAELRAEAQRIIAEHPEAKENEK